MSRREQLRQKIEQQAPIVRYSDEAEQKPEVKEVVQAVKPAQKIEPEKTDKKFKRKEPDGSTSLVRAIGNMGLEVAKGIRDAAKDFSMNIVDTVGNEIMPLYPQLKQAVGTVTEGVTKAAKIGYSAFTRVPEKKATDTVRTKTDSKFERLVTSTSNTEKISKWTETKQAHRDHKLYGVVKDTHDLIRDKMLIDLLTNSKVLLGLAAIGTNLLTGFGLFSASGFIGKMFSGLWDSIKGIGTKISDMWDGIKKWLDSMKEGAKKIAGEAVDTVKSGYKKAKDFIFGSEPEPVLDREGKPVIGEDGKPKMKMSVEKIDGQPSKFGKQVKPENVKVDTPSAKPSAGAKAGTEIAGEAVEKGAASEAVKFITDGLGSMFKGIMTLLKGISLPFDIELLAGAVSYATGKGEEYEKVNERRYSRQGLNDVNNIQRGLPMASDQVEVSEAQKQQAEKQAEQRRESTRIKAQQAMMVNAPTTVTNNIHQAEPFRFPLDSQLEARPYGIQARGLW